jgi:uncharacterized protein YraI
MPNQTYAAPGATDTIVAPATRTTSADTGPITGWGAIQTIRTQLAVTTVAGTTPSLTVVVEDSLDGVTWWQLATFTPATAVGAQVINIGKPFTDRLRWRWTITGTLASFAFAVTTYTE